MLRCPIPPYSTALTTNRKSVPLPPRYVHRDKHLTEQDWIRQIEAISAACQADPSRLLTINDVRAALAAERASFRPSR